MEYWSIGVVGVGPNTPSLHYSKILRSSQPFQVRSEVDRIPPRLYSQRLGNHPRRVISRCAGDIAARMTRTTAEKYSIDVRAIIAPTRERAILQLLDPRVLAHQPIAAVHVAIVALDVERGRRVGG